MSQSGPLLQGDNDEPGQWKEYRNLVVSELRRLDGESKQHFENRNEDREELVILKTKAAGFGAIAGLIAGAGITGIIELVIKAFSK